MSENTIRNALGLLQDDPDHEQAVGAVLNRVVDERGAVHACSGNRGKERLRRALLAAIDGVGHADIRTADETGRRQQRAKTHGNAHHGPLGHAEDLPVEIVCVHASSAVSKWRRAQNRGGTKQFSAGLWETFCEEEELQNR